MARRVRIDDWKFHINRHARDRFEERVRPRLDEEYESIEDFMSYAKLAERVILKAVRNSCPSGTDDDLSYLRVKQGDFVFVAPVVITRWRWPTRVDCIVKTFLVYERVVSYKPLWRLE